MYIAHIQRASFSIEHLIAISVPINNYFHIHLVCEHARACACSLVCLKINQMFRSAQFSLNHITQRDYLISANEKEIATEPHECFKTEPHEERSLSVCVKMYHRR